MKAFSRLFLLTLVFLQGLLHAQICASLKDQLGREGTITLSCGDLSATHCTNLIATLPVYPDSESYAVSSIPYQPVGNFNDGTVLDIYGSNAVRDEDYVKRFSFSNALFGSKPFLFSYYGNTFDSFIISSNGFISFREVLAENDFSSGDFAGNSIPSEMLPRLSVFGVYQDVEFVQGESSISVKVEGSYPCRKLAINFYRARIVGTNQYTTSQIVLTEGTGVVEVFVQNKPIPDAAARMKESVIGITNDENDGLVPASRNTGVWASQNEGFRFTPNGRTMTRAIQWFKNGARLNSSAYNNRLTVNVCPKDPTETFTVKSINTMRSGETLVIEKEIKFTYAPTYPLTQDYTESVCTGSTTNYYQSEFNPKLVLGIASNFTFKYYTTAAEANTGLGSGLAPTTPLELSDVYYVRVENKLDPSCFRTAVLKFENVANALKSDIVEVCESMRMNFALSRIQCQVFDPTFKPTSVRYRVDNPTGPFVTTANLSDTSKIYMVAMTSCGEMTYGPISVKITEGPPLASFSVPIEMNICDTILPGNTNPPKRETNFDWAQYFIDHGINFSTDPNTIVTVHTTEANARNNTGIMTYINEGNPTLDYTYDVYVRISPADLDETVCKTQCSTIVKVSVKVKFTSIILNINDADRDAVPDDPAVFDTEDANVYLCRTGVVQMVNLKTDFAGIINITSPAGGVGLTESFHATLADAMDPLSSGIPAAQTLAANVTTKIFFVRYSMSTDPLRTCYVVKRLVYSIVTFPVRARTTPIAVCTTNGQSASITLGDYTTMILGSMASQNPRPTVKFYDSSAANNEISTINLDATTPIKSVFVRVASSYNPNCSSEIFEYKFSLQNTDVLKDQVTININCDNNNDGKNIVNLKDYESLFLGNPADNTVRYFRNYNANNNTFSGEVTATAQNFELIASGNQTIYARVAKGSSACFTVVRLNFTIAISNTPIKLLENQLILQCNITGQHVNFNLNTVIMKLYDSSNPEYSTFISEVHFYESRKDAEGDMNRIADSSAYPLNVTEVRRNIWARFVSKNGCYTVIPFTIKITNPTDINFTQNEPPMPICDNNLSGQYTFNLRDWVNAKISASTPTDSFLRDYEATLGATFTFHLIDGGPTLTRDEEINFHPDPINQKFVIIKADGGGGSCTSTMTIEFDFGDISTIPLSISGFCTDSPIDLTQIKNDPKIATAIGFEFFPTEDDLKNNINKIDNKTQFLIGDLDFVYVKILYPTGTCPRKGIVNFEPLPTPVFTMYSDLFVYCKNSDYVDIKINTYLLDIAGITPVRYKITVPNGFEKSGPYTQTSIHNTNIEGFYQVTLFSENGCSYTAEPIELRPFDVPKIIEIVVDNDMVKIIAKGSNPNRLLEYTYEGQGKWQSNYVFYNVPKGINKFFVRYVDNYLENGCFSEPMETLILDIPNAITPNGDGINDVWKISDLNFYNGESSSIKIYDRFNKLLFEKSSNEELVWDGYYGGSPLPTSTYWYVLSLPDGRNVTGWILVKNRD